jgi:hypothetical protein
VSKIILGSVIENISTRQDGSFKIVIGTQEIDKSQVSDLFEMRNKFCKVLFSSSNITDLEAVTVDSESLVGTKKKSPSQRLRAVLYRLWEASGYQVDFDGFYQAEMERIIEGVKEKLNQAA